MVCIARFKGLSLIATLLGVITLVGCGGGGGDSKEAPAVPALGLSVGQQHVALDWAAASGAEYYRVYRNSDDASGFALIADNLSATDYLDTTPVHLTNWLELKFFVKACNSVGCTSSLPVNVTTGVDDLGIVHNVIAYLKPENSDLNDLFGFTVALDAEGVTLAISAPGEWGGAIGVNGAYDNSTPDSGAVYVMSRAPDSGQYDWVQQAYIKASNTDADDAFGWWVALSEDGNTLAVGAPNEDSSTTGVNSGADNIAMDSGAVYVFVRRDGIWEQQAFVKASNSGNFDRFGWSVALSGDGDTLAVGAPGEDLSGATYIYTRVGGNWTEQVLLKASNAEALDLFGGSVSLGLNGERLAVGAIGEDSAATGVNDNENDNSVDSSGAVYLFDRSGTKWNQTAYVKASNSDPLDGFGWNVGLAASGNLLLVGAPFEDSADTFKQTPDQFDNTATDAGAAYLLNFEQVSGWQQIGYLKATNTEAGQLFGSAVALTSDLGVTAIGAPGDNSSGRGVGADSFDTSMATSGAVHLMTSSQNGINSYMKASNTDAGDGFGESLALSQDGLTLAVGARHEASINGDLESNDFDDIGAVYVY